MDNIQGKDAILYFYKEDYTPFACATEISISIDTEDMPVRTIGDGNYKKSRYQTTGYTVTLGGVVVFDDGKYTTWDLLDNQLGYVHVDFRCTFTSANGNIKSIQGQCKISNSGISIRPGSVVTSNFTLTGNGKIDLFDGAVPCDGVITDIIFTDLDNSDNQIAIAYAFTGSPIRVNWYVDEFTDTPKTGFVEAGHTIFINDIATGAHSIRLEPVCASDFTGVDLSADFIVTAGETCNIAISSVTHTVAAQSITWTMTTTGGNPSTNYVRILRNGTEVYNGSYASTITLNSIPFGTSTFTYEFYCENNLLGDSQTEDINVPGGAKVQVWFQNDAGGGSPPTARLLVERNGATLAFVASPYLQTFDILTTDVISASTQSGSLRRLVVSNSDFVVLYNNAGNSLSFTIPTIVSGKTYFITFQLP